MSARLSCRARYVVEWLKNPDQKVRWSQTELYSLREWCGTDGEWFCLYSIPNIGIKTIRELRAAGAIEGHPSLPYYRRVVDESELDFGDLWVAV
jgi:hypothetical protein